MHEHKFKVGQSVSFTSGAFGRGGTSGITQLLPPEGDDHQLPSTLVTPESNGGVDTVLRFERIIVWPDGRREIEGVTPKQLPAPASHELPNSANDIPSLAISKT